MQIEDISVLGQELVHKLNLSSYAGKDLQFIATTAGGGRIIKNFTVDDDGGGFSGISDLPVSGCSSCEGQCGKNCANECKGSCGSNCVGGCKTTCRDTCTGSCQAYCNNSCQNGCTDSCYGGCQGGCTGSCGNSCTQGCAYTCAENVGLN